MLTNSARTLIQNFTRKLPLQKRFKTQDFRLKKTKISLNQQQFRLKNQIFRHFINKPKQQTTYQEMQTEEQTVDFNFDISEIPISAFEPNPLSYYQHNRARLQENLKKHVGDNYKPGSIAIFKGHHEHYNNHDDDATSDFSPEWNFFYLFGFQGQWDCYAVFNFCTGETVVALKKKSEIGQIFEGGLTVKDDPKKYGVDKFIWVDDLRSYVESLNAPEIYVMKGQVRDEMSHYASFDWLDSHPK